MIHTLAWIYAMFIAVMLMLEAWRDRTNDRSTVTVMRVLLTVFAVSVFILI